VSCDSGRCWGGWRPAAGVCCRAETFSYIQWRTQEFYSPGGVQQIELRTEDEENGDLGDGSPLVRGFVGSCYLVQEISFHVVKFS